MDGKRVVSDEAILAGRIDYPHSPPRRDHHQPLAGPSQNFNKIKMVYFIGPSARFVACCPEKLLRPLQHVRRDQTRQAGSGPNFLNFPSSIFWGHESLAAQADDRFGVL